MKSQIIPMTIDEFHTMPWQLGWKHEYWEGAARISPSYTAVATVSIAVTPRLVAPPCLLRPVTEADLPLLYVNQICGQDELVFDGASFVLNADRRLAFQAPAWREHIATTTWSRGNNGAWSCAKGEMHATPDRLESIYQAMILGLRDYVTKNRFPGIAIGLSGGIDSALSAAVAVDALGADKVWCVMMPSPYTSTDSLEDAAAVAKAIGARLDTISIEPSMKAFAAMLQPAFAGKSPDITEENLQARSRGIT